VGTLTFVRVYSGVLASGDGVINSVKGKKSSQGRSWLYSESRDGRN